jgi:biopolymer transport protein ExbB
MMKTFRRIADRVAAWPFAFLVGLTVAVGAAGQAYGQESEPADRPAPAEGRSTQTGSGPDAPPAVAPTGEADAEDALTEMPAPPPEADGLQEVDNPYGMRAAWRQGDWVTRGTFLLLLLMSVATWYILFIKLWEQERMFAESKRANNEFWKSPSVSEGISKLREGSPYWYVAERGLSASEHHEGTLVERIDLSEWITMSVNRAVNEVGARLQSGLAVLATVGSTAPFVGLFGTVWGIYHALTAIGISGQASIDKVAGPVGEALIMTALGLAVAVPAVWAYNWLVRRNKVVLDTVRAFSSDLHSVLLSGTRVGKVGNYAA